ncbi:hypothetical protein TSUD_266620 [Trifolium subterraneum]|uniref:F-box associated domain-containing protein n=1 Tax=Trifolium subterraneum TaxID=3900 RepID=A0A2Z6M5K1_TRISU|nr:hypothetical protein TSUD_266620 [Trifolium subterraneum]
MRDDGGEKKKSGGIWETSPWVGKHLILVKAVVGGVKSIFVVVDLEEQKIVMESKVPVFSDNRFESTAVLHEGTLSVLNMCLEEYTNSDFSLEIPLDSDECNSSTLDLTKNPPEWSGGWTSLPKMNIKRLLPPVVVLYNKIYVFDFDSKDHPAEVYQIGGNKWEKITTPSGNLLDKPIPDPKGNRLIAFFDDSLYAYHPNIEKWNLVHQHLSRDNPLDASDVIVWGDDDS